MKRSQKLAVSGLLTAFASVVLILSNFVPVGMYTFPAAAGLILWVLSFAAGRQYALYAYAAVSVIGFLICSNKEAPLCFILFLGYYPLLRPFLEKLRFRGLSYILKLLLFNAAAVGTYFLLLYVFSVPTEDFRLFGISLPLVFLLLLNVVFLVYDVALKLFERKYRETINKLVTNFFRRF